ncbi:FAD-dependent monooxygenase [Salinibius halmophilus]|uniref:FAD-dependent monooxygenase n=1 Tax=Salinibius halmophilus TaxID=1853216 RepID=UPI000E66A5C2|nr:FAD-dependent monooxygenase [Salinibius halmophilus]
MQQFDIIIVGAGMVGSALAHALRGKKVALVDRGAPVTARSDGSDWQTLSNRVSAVSLAHWQWLDSLLAQPIKRSPYTAMLVTDGDGCSDITLADQGNHIGALTDNWRIQYALQQALDRNSVTCFWHSELSEWQPNQITLSTGQVLHADIIVAADGANSWLRQQVGIEVKQLDYQQWAQVANLKLATNHQNKCYQTFRQTGPIAILPMYEANQASLVWSSTEPAEELDDVAFTGALNAEIASLPVRVEAVTQRQSFPLIARHAKTYAKDGVILIGDAAHNIHPLAGQGVNLGFSDVKVLAKFLNASKNLSDPIIAQRYEQARRLHNASIRHAMTAFAKGFGSNNPYLRLARNNAFRLANRFSAVLQPLINVATRHD